MMNFDLSPLPGNLRLGTSSFSWPDWRGTFYPPGASPSEFLAHYASRLPTVEIDATWYAMPSPRTVEEWARKAPDGFVFSMKVPRVITHDKALVDCGDDWRRFLEVTAPLGPKRGPLLFQFPYVAKGKDADEYQTGRGFLGRLEAFLPLVPDGVRCAVEIRNEKWLAGPLLDLLRSRGIALALVHYFTMPGPVKLFAGPDPITADFTVIRFLGNHKSMDALVAEARAEGRRASDWESLIVDRSREIAAWVPPLRRLAGRGTDIFAYFNNHFAGFAPGSIEMFLRQWSGTPGPDAGPLSG